MKNSLRVLGLSGALLTGGWQAHAQIIISDDGSGTGTTTWTNDNIYVLDNFVFVNDGQTLTIEPGTIIKGQAGQEADASALIVARGGTIIAEGTAEEPIIFTFEDDPLDGSTDIYTRGQWGGVIILGNAPLNSAPGETAIEGIPTTEPRGIYGGDDENDNSGIMRYISIRHGGTNIGAGNEINGFTLGGVGRGTTLEFIEVISNVDDGIEFFGGTVDLKYATVAFCGDDSFDYDEGWTGRGQYWFAVQGGDGEGDRGGEHDGGTDPEDGMPFALPVIHNATYIGNNDGRALTFRDNAGGHYNNSIFSNWANWVDVENLASGEDTYARFLAGEWSMSGNVFQTTSNACANVNEDASDIFTISMGSGGWASDADSIAVLNESSAALAEAFEANGNKIANTGIVWENGNFNPVPTHNYSSPVAPEDSWFDNVPFKGAFAPGLTPWVEGWTLLSQSEFYNVDYLETGSNIVVTDNGSGTGTTTWTNNNTYELDNFVFVNDGQCLVIQPGTVIKGQEGQEANASALVVARGGKIFAEGHQFAPIIMTFAADPLDGSVDPLTDGQWGGFIMLGNAPLNSAPGETAIEGIPTTEPRGIYGGDDEDDNSGIVRYVSIRHGGTNIGAGNEINGFTLGGVGRGTEIEYVEVFSNVDDGVEWFGGTVDTKHLVVAFCGDDSFDYDEGFTGRGQYWFAVQAPGRGDRGGEHDGGTDPEDGTPYATPVIYNATYIGNGENRALTLRDNAGGQYWNSIFANWERGFDVENLASGEDSYERFLDGDLAFAGNLFWEIAQGTEADDLFTISMGTGGWSSEADSLNILNASSTELAASFGELGNQYGDPGLCFTYELSQSGGLFPAPSENFTAPTSPTDPWFDDVDFRGAFDPFTAGVDNGLWIHGWTALDFYGYLDAVCTSSTNDLEVVRGGLELFPNPSTGQFNVVINETMSDVNVEVFDMVGKRVAAQEGLNLNAGSQVSFNVNSLPNGVYIVVVSSNGTATTGKIVKR